MSYHPLAHTIKSLPTLLAGLTLACSVTMTPALAEPPMRNELPMIMLTPGLYFTEDLPKALPKEGLVMCGSGLGQSRLVKGTLSFQQTKHPLDPDSEIPRGAKADMSGCETSQGEKAWFFIADKSHKLKPGPVTTLSKPTFEGDEWQYLSGLHLESSPARFTLGAQTYNVTLQTLQKKADGGRYRILLQSPKSQQSIVERAFGGTANAEVLWAGDLDGDKKLDLVTSHEYEEYTLFAKVLFLSSFAKTPNLVTPVAKFVESTD
jgi:hypothetical protein